jgi:hypothetical protein
MADVLHRILFNRLTIPLTPFYRRYPRARGGVSVSSADARGCVDMAGGYFYNRIPKAANSTVVVSLARLSGRELTSREAKRQCRTPSQLRGREVEALDGLFRFSVVRNPFTRTLSAYLDKIERRATRRGEESSYNAFLDSLANGALYENAHWAPQCTLLLLPFEAFDFIGRVESLEEDLSHILARLGSKQPAAQITAETGNATGAAAKLREYYDDGAVARVRALYREDFERFGYATTLPL